MIDLVVKAIYELWKWTTKTEVMRKETTESDKGKNGKVRKKHFLHSFFAYVRRELKVVGPTYLVSLFSISLLNQTQ